MTTSKLRTLSAAFAVALGLVTAGQAVVPDAHAKVNTRYYAQNGQGFWCTTLMNAYNDTGGWDLAVDGHASTQATAGDYAAVGNMSGCATWAW
jgi:hypothetical protein